MYKLKCHSFLKGHYQNSDRKMHLSRFVFGFFCCCLICDLADALTCRSDGGSKLSELKNVMMGCVKKYTKMMNNNSSRGSQYERRYDGKVHVNERDRFGSGTGMDKGDGANMGRMNSNQNSNAGNNNRRYKRQYRRDMTSSMQNSNQRDQYNPQSNHRDSSYMTSSGNNDPYMTSSNSFGSSSGDFGSSSGSFGSSSGGFGSSSDDFGSSGGFGSSSGGFGSSSGGFGRSSNPYIGASDPYDIKSEYNGERDTFGFGQGETRFQDRSGSRGDRSPFESNSNQNKGYDNGKNYEDDRRMNMSFSLNDLKNHECIIHCFLENLDMTGDNGMPDKYMVTQKLMKDVQSEDLKDFLQESVEECFQLIYNDKVLDKCQFSKNLMTCLSEKGKSNCDDWDAESFDSK